VNGLLLDTHAWIWAVAQPQLLPERLRTVLATYTGPIYASSATFMEIAIKISLGKLTLHEPDLARYVTRANAESQFELLDVSLKHLAVLQELPWHHRDPFDRMIIAQAKEMGLTVVTRDPSFALYGVDVLWDAPQRRRARRS
jgi:PIN domain nuclease of toxin-antitoxin system